MSSINRNSYVPTYTPPEERDFLSYLDDLKYEEAMANLDYFIKNIKIVNFDIMHHECGGRLLQNSYEHYQRVREKQFQNYKIEPKDKLLNAAFCNQDNTKQSIYFEKGVVKKRRKKCLRKKSFK